MRGGGGRNVLRESLPQLPFELVAYQTKVLTSHIQLPELVIESPKPADGSRAPVTLIAGSPSPEVTDTSLLLRAKRRDPLRSGITRETNTQLPGTKLNDYEIILST